MRRTLALLLALALIAPSQANLVTMSGQTSATAEGGGNDALTIDLEVNRTSCTAPCAIAFDLTGTTHTDGDVNTFRDVGYELDFDDSSSGTWTYSGLSKNEEAGAPLAAHVFETAGTYEVLATACYDTDADGTCETGEYVETSVTITVAAADTTYSSTNTICLSTNTDHTGCPSGATQTSNVSAWPTWADNRRYLLHAGQDFSSLDPIDWSGIQDSQLGSYGSGAKPIVPYISLEMGTPAADPPQWAARLAFYDLNVGESGVYSFQTGKSTEDILVLRMDAQGLIAFNHNANDHFDNYVERGLTLQQRDAIRRAVNTFVVESNVGTLSTFNASGRGIYLLGNTADSPEEHSMRLWQGYKVLVAHNLLSNAGSSQHQFKMHSAGLETPYDDDLVDSREPASAQVIVRYNDVGDASESNPQALTFGPQSSSTPGEDIEGMEDVIVELNHFLYDFQDEILLGGRRMTARGNTSVGTINYTTDYNFTGKPELADWSGPYQTGGTAIPTRDPTP